MQSNTQNLASIKLSNGNDLNLSTSKHNKVLSAIVHEFASRFAKSSEVIYLGDTTNKDLYVDKKILKELGIPTNDCSILPDMIIYDRTKNRAFFIDAITSKGTITTGRAFELDEFLKKCKAGKIYFSAFLKRSEFTKQISNIAWKTHVWMADVPEHTIYYE